MKQFHFKVIAYLLALVLSLSSSVNSFVTHDVSLAGRRRLEPLFFRRKRRRNRNNGSGFGRLWRRSEPTQEFFGSLPEVRNSLDFDTTTTTTSVGMSVLPTMMKSASVSYGPMDLGTLMGTDSNGNRFFRVWRDRLLQVSKFGSILCMLDCTILPMVTVLMPLLGFAASPAQMEWLHELGHSIALFFVLPVGGLAATMNYVSHKKKWLSFMALVGLSLVYAANGSGGPLLSLLSHDWRHALHCGTVLHRVVNVSGCALLLSSNYMGHRHSCKDANCNHLH